MRAAAVQFKASKGDLVGSRERLTALVDEAAREADLVVLPEMATSGYVFDGPEALAEVAEVPEGRTYQALSGVARAHGCWVVCGFPERARAGLYNSAMVVDDQGRLVFVYRKTLLFEIDESWARTGDSGYRRFRTRGGAFGVGICMDINDPRFLLWVWRARLDAVAFPTNWIDEGSDVWPYWAERIHGSGTTLVAANTYGAEAGLRFSGRSAILSDERVLAGGPMKGDAVIRADW